MTRFASSDQDAAAELPHVPYVIFAEFDFASGFVRVNSSDRSFTHEGNTYTGLGHLAGIGPVRENGDLIPEKLEFTLSGVESSLITTTLTEDYHGRAVKLWLSYLDEDMQLIDTPELMSECEMDTMSIHRDHGKVEVHLVAENRLIRWDQRAGWLYTREHQQLFDATDSFLNLVATLPNKKIRWAGQSVTTGSPTRPGPVPPGYQQP